MEEDCKEATKGLLLPCKEGNPANFGTKLIPVFDACTALSVATIGSYFASPAYRDLNQTIFYLDNTCHKEVTALHRKQLPKPKPRRRVNSLPRNPSHQRELLLQNKQSVPANWFSDSLSASASCDGLRLNLANLIGDNQIPPDRLLAAALERAIARLPARMFKDGAKYNLVLADFRMEARDNYVYGAKKAIIEYLLRSEQERKRLGVGPSELFNMPDHHSHCLTIRAPVPWKESLLANKATFRTQILTMKPFLEKLRCLWYSKFASLNFLNKIDFPVDVQFFRSQVTLNCEMIRFKLNYEWASLAAAAFVDSRKGNLLLDLRERSDDFRMLETIETFMSRLLRQFTLDNIESWVEIASPTSEGRKELFVARANFSTGYQCQLDPSPNEWPRIVVHPINEILSATQSLPRLERQLLLQEKDNFGHALKFVTSVKEEDYDILSLKADLLNLVSESDSDSLIREADNKITKLMNFNSSKRDVFDLATLRRLIKEQEAFEDQSVYETDFNWAAGIMLVNYSELKKKMALETRKVVKS